MNPFIRMLVLAPWLLAPAAWAADRVWIEGEAPASINMKSNIAGWGRKELLSGETWLHVSMDADKVAKHVPAQGILIRYSFQVAGPVFEIWDRIGFEFVRSRFDWRVDGGDWTTVARTS